jgi:hypothetical protein
MVLVLTFILETNVINLAVVIAVVVSVVGTQCAN